MENIGKYDKREAFLAIVKLIEIKGENKLISEIQDSAIKALKNKYKEGLDIDFIISLILAARKDAINSI